MISASNSFENNLKLPFPEKKHWLQFMSGVHGKKNYSDSWSFVKFSFFYRKKWNVICKENNIAVYQMSLLVFFQPSSPFQFNCVYFCKKYCHLVWHGEELNSSLTMSLGAGALEVSGG